MNLTIPAAQLKGIIHKKNTKTIYMTSSAVTVSFPYFTFMYINFTLIKLSTYKPTNCV